MKKLKITALLLLVLLLAGLTYIATSGPRLPPETDQVLDRVVAAPLPELVLGTTGYAQSQGVKIWYERIQPAVAPKGTVLLIMGISNDALGWPPSFIQALVDSGYQIIIYDHRGTGLSDWLPDWTRSQPYSLATMADDAVAVLDAAGVGQAHVVGISMGGMIAQELAIAHPGRVRTLTSMMSSGFIQDPGLPPISSRVAGELIRSYLRYGLIGGEKNQIRLHLATRTILMGKASYALNTAEIAQQVLYNLRRRRGYNTRVSEQHQTAVYLSGSRYPQLRQLRVPTLIVHGLADPFIPLAHGRKCASLIPGADSLWVAGMGHDLPARFIGTLTARLVAHWQKRPSGYYQPFSALLQPATSPAATTAHR